MFVFDALSLPIRRYICGIMMVKTTTMAMNNECIPKTIAALRRATGYFEEKVVTPESAHTIGKRTVNRNGNPIIRNKFASANCRSSHPSRMVVSESSCDCGVFVRGICSHYIVHNWRLRSILDIIAFLHCYAQHCTTHFTNPFAD
jgi:hypothetical protein